MGDSFAHLHVHTEYSMLDGAARLKDLFVEANRLGMSAVAITDHGNMPRRERLLQAVDGRRITPILGVEAYVAPESRYHKARVKWGRPEQKSDDISGNGAITHKTMWAKNAQGLKNLFTLNSRASMEGHYIKWPRMDMELIAEYAEGIMATTGCPSGAVQTRLRLGQFDEALKVAANYQDIFGKDNYFVEIMDHGLSIESRVRQGLTEIARKLDIPPVVTNDSHYTVEEQATAHDVLLCVQTASNIDDPNRFRLEGGGYFIKSADQMRAVDSSELWQQGCRNTLLVAEKVTEGMFEFHNLCPLPGARGVTEESWSARRPSSPGPPLPPRHPRGARRACRVRAWRLNQMAPGLLPGSPTSPVGPRHGISVGPGRASAAASLVATRCHHRPGPIQHGLIFDGPPPDGSDADVYIDFASVTWRGDQYFPTMGLGQAPNRHLRPDQGEGLHQGLCSVLGFPSRRTAHQGDAAVVMGKDIPPPAPSTEAPLYARPAIPACLSAHVRKSSTARHRGLILQTGSRRRGLRSADRSQPSR